MALTTHLGNWTLKNPLIPASGTFGFGLDYLDFYDVNMVGTFSIKGTTLHYRNGNPLPRIAEYGGGMLNSVGLQNPGVHEVLNILKETQKVFNDKIIANVSGFSIEEYVETASLLDKEECVGLIELNISCPNVHGGGASFGMDIPLAVEVLKAVKQVCHKPVYVKCTPLCPDLIKMCVALEENGADGLVLCNTYLGMRIDVKSGKPLLANITGGVSGKGIFPLALQKVYAVYPHVHIPIIGNGGVSSADDVLEMMMAGASAVEIGTANLVEPLTVPHILEDLPKRMSELGIDQIKDIIGRAHHE